MSRRNKRKKLRKKLIYQLPWQEVVTKFSALEIISQDEIESIHHASLDVLESVGMKVLHQDARKIFKDSGLDVNESSQMVYFDRDLVLNKIKTPPKEFTLRARNPKRDLTFGRKPSLSLVQLVAQLIAVTLMEADGEELLRIFRIT